MIDQAQTARERDRLPRGWGRFGKAIDGLVELSEPDEALLASCVGLNPSFQHRSITLVGAMGELQKSTNVILAATDRRVVILSTGFAGGRREHVVIPYDGLEVAELAKKEITLRWPEGEMRVKGCAKQMLPGFAAAVSSQARPA